MAEHQVFDRKQVRRHRDRVAHNFRDFDFLKAEVGLRLCDRLEDINRQFPIVLDLGCHTGEMGRLLAYRKDIELLIQSDMSERMLKVAHGPRVVADEEFLPFADESLNLVVSALSLHWVNDLPGALIQINRALQPDGLFLAAILGGRTLQELRQVLMQAEMQLLNGAGLHVSPFADVRDAGSLLQRAGFALPVTDTEILTVDYPDMFALLKDLRGMGETNALIERQTTPIRRDILMHAAELYHELYSRPDGRIEATFEVIYLTGWAPHESQQKPLAPGSAKARLADALGAKEESAGEKTAPKKKASR